MASSAQVRESFFIDTSVLGQGVSLLLRRGVLEVFLRLGSDLLSFESYRKPLCSAVSDTCFVGLGFFAAY